MAARPEFVDADAEGHVEVGQDLIVNGQRFRPPVCIKARGDIAFRELLDPDVNAEPQLFVPRQILRPGKRQRQFGIAMPGRGSRRSERFL